MKLLLHCCCAPCLIYPLQQLRAKGFEVAGIFYNPNIHPFFEYKKRREAVQGFSKSVDINIIYPDYKPEEFFQAVNPVRNSLSQSEISNGVNLKEKTAERCSLCWYLRLEETVVLAKELGFEYFSTTLLVSPYQNQKLLKNIGIDLSKEKGISFYYEDFRIGFRQAHNTAKSQGMYCQKYCGCIYSEMERCNLLQAKSIKNLDK